MPETTHTPIPTGPPPELVKGQVVHDGVDRETWLAAREGFITASDVAAVLNLHAYKSRNQLFREKTGQVAYRDLSGVPKIMAGRFLEEGIVRWFLHDMGNFVTGGGMWGHLVSRADCPSMAATPDAWTLMGGGLVLIEAKNISEKSADRWDKDVRVPKAWTRSYNPWAGFAPVEYWVQLQVQLHVTGATLGYLTACIGGQRRKDVMFEYDAAFCAEAAQEVEAFMGDVRECRALAAEGGTYGK